MRSGTALNGELLDDNGEFFPRLFGLCQLTSSFQFLIELRTDHFIQLTCKYLKNNKTCKARSINCGIKKLNFLTCRLEEAILSSTK